MKDTYTEKRGAFDSDEATFDIDGFDREEIDFTDDSKDITFHVGQSYEHKPAESIKCKKCGGHEFNVGFGCYVTVIRCPVCKWESVVHSG